MDEAASYSDHLRKNSNRVNNSELQALGFTEKLIGDASALITNLRTTSGLINTLSESERSPFLAVKNSYTEDKMAADGFFNMKKHDARYALLKQFTSLSDEELFIIVRILQISPEAIALDVTNTSKHARVFESLGKKGLLIKEKGNLKAPWAPYPWLFRNIQFQFYPIKSV